MSWQVTKQRVVARSSTESEYRANIASTIAELTWMQFILKDLGVTKVTTLILWYDNLSATFLAINPILHSRIKHAEIDFYFIR